MSAPSPGVAADRARDRLRNLLIGAGAYLAFAWLAFGASIGWGAVIDGVIFRGALGAAVLLPLAVNLPQAVLAFATGAVTATLVTSARPARWALVPAALIGLEELWSTTLVDDAPGSSVVGVYFGAAVLVAACLAGAALAAARGKRRTAGLT